MILTAVMAHPRTLIRKAVAALLISANTAAGARVRGGRVDPIIATKLPELAVYTRSEEVDVVSKGTAPRELTRMVHIEIVGWVAHSEGVNAYDAMDNLAQQVEAAMDANRYLVVAQKITGVDPTTGQLTIPQHGLDNGTAPAFIASTGTVPGGSARGVPYYINVVDPNTVTLSSYGNPAEAITFADAGTGQLQLLVSTAADSILDETEMQILGDDGRTDPLVGEVTLTYVVTYRSMPATPTNLADLTTIDATYPIVGGTATTPIVEDNFTLESA